jgi:hypothetical protein
MSATVDYRYNYGDAFVTGAFKNCNREGIVAPILSGTDFRARIKSTSSANFNLDYVNVLYKVVDKRFIRGIGASSG